MILGVPKETQPDERRVALVPGVVPTLSRVGLQVMVESGAGAASGHPDAAYAEKGAHVSASRDEVFGSAAVILQVQGCGAHRGADARDLERLRDGQVIIALFDPLGSWDAIREVARTGAVAFALELLPRVARAQSMDVLSSMATLSGYKAVLLGAVHLPKVLPMLMTAAGTLTPARVLVLGAGVAGLQAIATARRLGAIVEAYDVRPGVKEQVESLGARFLDLPLEPGRAEDPSGYATAQDEAFYGRQRELLSRAVAKSDLVITTALVPGAKAPTLVSAEMVAAMTPGAVIVDMAAEQGGNCALTRLDSTVVEHGVTILGPVNLPATVPHHASQMYARNVTAFLLHVVREGAIQSDRADEIVRETLLTQGREVVHPQGRAALGLVPAGAKRGV